MEIYDLITLAQSGDKAAKEQILNENTGLIWSVVKKFSNRGYESEDLFQVGCIGLIKCIDKFDISYEVRFSTYAVPMIMGEIKRFLRDDGMIKVSRPIKEMAAKAKYMQEKLTHQNGKSPTVDELAAALETSVEDLVVAMESSFEVESLYQTINQQDGSTAYLMDKLDRLEGEDDKMIDIIALKQIIGNLDPKDRQVIVMRYFQDKTQTQVANAIGVSQVQISRIEKKILKSIREKFG